MNTPRQPINQAINQPLGPLFIDIAGTELTDLDRERLSHPLVGGIILFSRNYQDREQLTRLCSDIHGLRSPRLPITIDHEGGRVQRCREGFTALPPMARLGQLRDEAGAEKAAAAARQVGYVLAAELRACGVDFSFTPVLDLNYGRSAVIGTRAFHRQPVVVAQLAAALIEGLRQAGMGACGKHFPGHGWVEADSHVAIPVDERSWEEIQEDIRPYQLLRLDAVMPAHVIYPRIDNRSAGFSPVWIGKLRNSLGFNGVIFSDDLSMEGASVVGGVVERVQAARNAGCDALLVCNSPDAVGTLLKEWPGPVNDASANRIRCLLPAESAPDWTALLQAEHYTQALETIRNLQ